MCHGVEFNMSKILNFGSLNIDYVYSVPHFVQPGETLASLDRNVFAGGKGLNQSLAAKRAGGDVYHAGALGSKDNEVLMQVLTNDNINKDFIKLVDGPSGHTIIQVNEAGQNCIILFGGANNQITTADIDHAFNHFESGDYLILQNEINNIEYLINEGYKRGFKICFNVSPFSPKLLDLPLEKCSYLIVNEIEAAGIINLPVDTDAKLLIDKLSAKFSNTNIVLTLGVKGSYFKAPGEKPVFAKAFKVNAVDTTAAGDTYLGYLICSLSKGIAPQEAITISSAASAIAVTRKGACPSIPYMDEVQAFLARV